MTHVRFNPRPVSKTFNSLVDDFLNVMPSIYKDDVGTLNGRSFIPVNVKETANSYELELVAPGWQKEDFKLQLEENRLTISAEKKTEEEAKEEKQLRKEYVFQSFSRS